MENNYCVYIHINKINNKKYIGITKYGNNPNLRWKNGTHYETNLHFTNAIKKYGWDNFEHKILFNNLTKEEAGRLEKEFVEKYDLCNPDYGYNKLSGGIDNIIFTKQALEKMKLSGHKNKGKTRTKEQKKLISDKTKEAMNSPIIKEKMREIYDSKEWREYNSKTTKELWKNSNLRQKVIEANGKPVRCIETNEIFESASEAGRLKNISMAGIRNCCKGKQKTSGNLHWEYYKCP